MKDNYIIVDIWDAVENSIKSSERQDVLMKILKICSDYGIEPSHDLDGENDNLDIVLKLYLDEDEEDESIYEEDEDEDWE